MFLGTFRPADQVFVVMNLEKLYFETIVREGENVKEPAFSPFPTTLLALLTPSHMTKFFT